MKEKHIIDNPPRYGDWSEDDNSQARSAYRPVQSATGGSRQENNGFDSDSEKKRSYEASPSYETSCPASASLPSFSGASSSSSRVVLEEDPIIKGEKEMTRSIRLYGNPLAKSHSWAVKSDDFLLEKLPSTKMSQKFKQQLRMGLPSDKPDKYPSFLRNPREYPAFSTRDFEQVVVYSKTDTSFFSLDGIEAKYPGEILAARDVSPADWYQFCQDLTVSLKRDATGDFIRLRTPIISALPLGAPLLRGVQSLAKGGEPSAFDRILRIWNERFLNQRGIGVIANISSPDGGKPLKSLSETTSRRSRKETRQRNSDLKKLQLVLTSLVSECPKYESIKN